MYSFLVTVKVTIGLKGKPMIQVSSFDDPHQRNKDILLFITRRCVGKIFTCDNPAK